MIRYMLDSCLSLSNLLLNMSVPLFPYLGNKIIKVSVLNVAKTYYFVSYLITIQNGIVKGR